MARKKSVVENIMDHAEASFEKSYPIPDPEASAPKKKTARTKKDLAPAYEASKEEAKQAQSISVTYTEATVPAEHVTIPVTRREAQPAEPITIPVTRREAQPAEPITVMVTRKDAAPKDGKPKKEPGRRYTIWIDDKTINLLDGYCGASKQKKTDVIRKAIVEYTDRYPLTEEQKKAYREKLQGIL